MDTRAAALARLFEAVHEGVYIGTLAPERDVTIAANAHLKVMLGLPSETAECDVHPLAAERFLDPQARQALLERLAADGSVASYLLRLRRTDQSPIWVELTARADEVATILSWSERLTQKAPVDPAVRRGIDIIHGESERAARIVRNLLTFARKRQTTRAMVDVNKVVRETLALRSYEQRVTNIAIIDALASGLPMIFADGHQLQQVLLNLVINAEQAMLSANGRGILVVRSWYDAEREAVTLEINDDGPGVPDELQPKIFDPFFTTKEVGKGTGLGLTVAYAIVQEHGGRIRLESMANRGASFFVELPVTGVKLAPTAAPTPEGQTSGGSVLVVEDEAALAAAVTDALRDAGYVVDRAGDGEEALAKVSASTFDAVICDLKMPRLDGKAFYRILSASSPGLARRVVFVTGDVAGTDAEQFLEQSGCRWLAKPFRLADLLRTLREAMA